MLVTKKAVKEHKDWQNNPVQTPLSGLHFLIFLQMSFKDPSLKNIKSFFSYFI